MSHPNRRGRRPGGFTLVELLVVIFIVVLVSAVTLPVVLPALQHHQVGEAARILQAALVGARDAAIRANAPRGIRLLPDPTFTPPTGQSSVNHSLAYNRWVSIEPAPDYSIGNVAITNTASNPGPKMLSDPKAASVTGPGLMPWFYPDELDPSFPGSRNPYPPFPSGPPGGVLMVEEEPFTVGPAGTLILNEPVNWWWNIRVGDKIQINDEGAYYTVIGPCEIHPGSIQFPGQNPELFTNVGPSGTTFSLSDQNGVSGNGLLSPFAREYTAPGGGSPFLQATQFLFLVNGQDDDGDGYTDDGWNGANENVNFSPTKLTPWVDELFEWNEPEQWLGSFNPRRRLRTTTNMDYTISRRPVPSPSAREVTLPANVVIDATTMGLGGTNERSRLPGIDPSSWYVDILLTSGGAVVPTTVYSSPNSKSLGDFFYHFWLTERVDVTEPQTPTSPYLNHLPLPQGVNSGVSSVLQGDRMLITLFGKNGQIVANTLENFNPNDPNAPFYAAQQGVGEAK